VAQEDHANRQTRRRARRRGWRVHSFLKLTTDEGLVGWREYSEQFGAAN
jgi:hypothetical protein